MLARATGAGHATWREAVIRFYLADNVTVPVDSFVFPAEEIRASWGHDGIDAGQEVHAAWSAHSPVPFVGIFEFRYTGPSGDGISRVTFACGPPAGGVHGKVPHISALSVVPGSVIEPGDTVMLDLTATGAQIWRATVEISGGCSAARTFAMPLQDELSTRLAMPVPVNCLIAQPLGVSVTITDIGLGQAQAGLAQPLLLVDATAPVMYVQLLGRNGFSSGTLGGDYLAGDTIALLLSATDNIGTRAMVWTIEPAGLRDSVLLSPAPVINQVPVRIPVRPAWGGTQTISVFARDNSGNESAIVASPPGAFHVIGAGPGQPVSYLRLNVDVQDVRFDQKRGVIYLLANYGQQIQVVSTSSYAVVHTINLPGPTRGFDLTAGGDSIVAAYPDSQALAVVDLRSAPEPVTIIRLPGLLPFPQQYPNAVRVTANGKAFVTTEGSTAASYALYDFDLATHALTPRGAPGVLGTSLDRSAMVVNGDSIRRYDAATNTFGPSRRANILSYLPVLDATGAHIAVSGQLLDASLNQTRVVDSMGIGGYAVALSPDGQRHYRYQFPEGVVVSHTSNGAAFDTIPDPTFAEAMWMSPDGNTLVTIEGHQGQQVPKAGILFIDLRKFP
jgi:hypothetical protein